MPRSGTSNHPVASAAIIVFAAALGLAACSTEPTGPGDASACVPESAEELCAAQGTECGRMDGPTDRCGQVREVHCGFCVAGKTCVDGRCKADQAHEADCADAVDEDFDGLTDCADSDCSAAAQCQPRPPVPCAKQKDCGDIVDEVVTDVCLGGTCKAPGAATYRGDAITSQVGIRLVFGGSLTGQTKPRTAVVRFVDSRRPDGSQLTCSLLKAVGNCKDMATRSRIDDNAAINQVFRSVYALDFSTCAGTECVFPSLFASVPQGSNYLLYGEAWYGARELNNPTGECAALYCAEGQAVGADGGTFQLTFR